jgi:hypothetical protein
MTVKLRLIQTSATTTPEGEHRVYEAHTADYCGDEEAG